MTSSVIGEWAEGSLREIERDDAIDFARAVGETDRNYVDGSRIVPTFATCLAWSVQSQAFSEVLPSTLGLHGEQSLIFSRPLSVGMTVWSRAGLKRVRPKKSGTTVTVETQTFAGSGTEDLVCTQFFTIFVVGEHLACKGDQSDPIGDRLDVGALPRLGFWNEKLPRDQPRRYAEVSGDRYGIHLDEEYAKQNGLPGVVAHGMSTLAYAARAVRKLGGGGEYRSLSARFSAPVFPGETLRTEVAGEGHDRVLSGAFSTTVGNGRIVIKNGRYELERQGSATFGGKGESHATE